MNGVTSSWPPTSPSHHVSQMLGNLAGSAKPPSTKLPTPIVALIIVPGRRVRQANKTTWDEPSNRCVDALSRFSSAAVISASSVLPPAIREDVESEPKVVALARNAPAAIAGHSPFPHKRQTRKRQPARRPHGARAGMKRCQCQRAFRKYKIDDCDNNSSKQWRQARRGPAGYLRDVTQPASQRIWFYGEDCSCRERARTHPDRPHRELEPLATTISSDTTRDKNFWSTQPFTRSSIRSKPSSRVRFSLGASVR